MYTIEQTAYGFRLTLRGISDSSEIDRMRMDLLELYSELDRPFSLVVDAREHRLLNPESKEEIARLHIATANMSLQRTAIVVDSVSQQGVSHQITRDSNTRSIDRVIDSSTVPNWEAVAIAWAAHGIEPDPEIIWD
jgi:hypothetical protein